MGGWSGSRAVRLARGCAGRRGRWCGGQEGPSMRIKEPGCRGRSGWSQAGARLRELGFDPSPGPSWPLPRLSIPFGHPRWRHVPWVGFSPSLDTAACGPPRPFPGGDVGLTPALPPGGPGRKDRAVNLHQAPLPMSSLAVRPWREGFAIHFPSGSSSFQPRESHPNPRVWRRLGPRPCRLSSAPPAG